MRKWKLRTRKLVKSGLQMRLIMVFLSLGCFAAFFQVYMINRAILAASQKLTVESDTLLSELPGILGISIVVTLAVLVPMMAAVGVITTHRIAGPVYRFETHLKGVARGEDMGVCRIRKGDELQELCELINEALAASRASGPRALDDAPAEESEPSARAA